MTEPPKQAVHDVVVVHVMQPTGQAVQVAVVETKYPLLQAVHVPAAPEQLAQFASVQAVQVLAVELKANIVEAHDEQRAVADEHKQLALQALQVTSVPVTA